MLYLKSKKVTQEYLLHFMPSHIRFDVLLNRCPACGGADLQHRFFQSTSSFMSLPNVWHDKCQNCGTVFVNPQPSKNELSKFYTSQETEAQVENSVIASSLSRYFDLDKREYFINHRINPICKYLEPSSTLVDIGCGTGVFVRFMKDRGFKVKGIDLSEKSIDYGRKELNLDSELLIASWEELPSVETYDAITAWTVIEHLPEPEAFLRKCNMALKPNVILLLEFPTVDSLLWRMLQSSFFWVMPPYHLVLFSRLGMQVLLSKTGFQLIESYPMPRNWYFTNSVARKCSIDIDKLLETSPEVGIIFREIDAIFDDIALELGESSSLQMICRKVSSVNNEIQ